MMVVAVRRIAKVTGRDIIGVLAVGAVMEVGMETVVIIIIPVVMDMVAAIMDMAMVMDGVMGMTMDIMMVMGMVAEGQILYCSCM